ncbi:MAG: hypothetical protein HY232_15660 [Acidobacteria bacterium]|nr:hypothetical protein [Acidobacteriota bacterium]
MFSATGPANSESENIMTQRVVRVLLVSIILALSPSIPAVDFNLFPFDPGLSQFMRCYHRDPQPQKALDCFFSLDLAKFEQRAKESNQPHSIAILYGFYATVLHQNPSLLAPFAKALASSSDGYRAAIGMEIMAYSGAPKRLNAIRFVGEKLSVSEKEMARYESLEEYPYKAMQPTDQYLLDIVWACYFASDDFTFLARIAAQLEPISATLEDTKVRLKAIGEKKPKPDSIEYREALALAQGEAARFALTEVAKDDPKTLSAIARLVANTSGNVSAQLEAILSRLGRVHRKNREEKRGA